LPTTTKYRSGLNRTSRQVL